MKRKKELRKRIRFLKAWNKLTGMPLIVGTAFFCFITFGVNAQTVNSWITNSNQSALLQQQPTVSFSSGGTATISVNDATTFQTIDGYGFCLTEGSAEAISTLGTTEQDNLLNDFFNPSTGIGVSVLRISIGASDLSSSSYSYNDGGVDVNQNNFSLSGPDLTYLIPLIKRILLINPTIKILATPWSAPKWMKTNNAWIGGSLNTSYFSSYATYFVKYINAMKAQGINIWAVTPQNEPENPYNEPSMTMNATDETTFINSYLGPAFQSAGFTTKIIAYDHNCDDTSYPTQVLNGTSYADGAAFHLYAGNVSALTTVHNATGKNVYFTEQYTSTGGSFGGDFPWHMQNVMIGSMTNWARTALEWNLATNASYGPKTPGGCTTCLGAVTVNNSTSYTRNVSFYIVAQFSKFVKTGAVRIASSSSNGNLQQVAFKNPDGSIVLVVYNTGGSQTFSVGYGSNTFSYTLAGSSAVSMVWQTTVPPSTGIVTTYQDCNYAGFYGGFSTGDYTLSQMQAIGVTDNSISSLQVRPGYKVILYENDNFGGASYTVTADESCVPSAWNDRVSSLQVLPNGVTGLDATYYIQNRNSGLYLNVSGGATDNGTKVIQWGLEEGANEQFAFTDTGNGVYKIIGVKSGRSLDITGVSTTPGAAVQIWDYYSTALNQQFIVAPTGDGFYKLIPRHSNQIIEVQNSSTSAGATVQQWDDNGQLCGQWKFVPVTTAGTGNGLAANYFNGMNFEELVYSTVDASINMDWGNGSPDASVNADGFSARWTGQLQPRFTDIYTFYMNSDNGRRLWINDQLVIDKWIDDWGTEYSGSIALTGGQKYEIKIEYFEDLGGANCKLEWSSFYQERQVVPQLQLYANQLPSASISSPANNTVITAPGPLVLNATANDGDGSVAKIDFYNGSVLLGTDNSAPYSYNWSGLTSGSYTIRALATDNRGGVSWSAPVTIKVNQAPSISINAPSDNSVYVLPATVDISVSASDADGTVAKVEFYSNGIKIGENSNAPYSYQWTGMSAGTYELTAMATDNDGASTTSGIITITVSLPTSIDPLVEKKGFILYPNPVSTVLQIQSNQSLSGFVYTIIDQSGHVVMQNIFDGKSISITDLKAGVYTILLKSDQQTFSNTIIKQ